jgi:hypothetical protein
VRKLQNEREFGWGQFAAKKGHYNSCHGSKRLGPASNVNTVLAGFARQSKHTSKAKATSTQTSGFISVLRCYSDTAFQTARKMKFVNLFLFLCCIIDARETE